MSMIIIMHEIRMPACSVCRDNFANEEQSVRGLLFGIGSKFGVCCRCKRQVHSIDRNYQRRWKRWYKKQQANQ